MYFSALTVSLILCLSSLEGVCELCEQIRERNRNTPPPEQEYYEDFLEAQRAEGKEPPGKIQFIDQEPEGEKEAKG